MTQTETEMEPLVKTQFQPNPKVRYIAFMVMTLIALSIGCFAYAARMSRPIHTHHSDVCDAAYMKYMHHVSPNSAKVMRDLIHNITQTGCGSVYTLRHNPKHPYAMPFILMRNIRAAAVENLRVLAEYHVYANNLGMMQEMVFQTALMYGNLEIIGLQYQAQGPEYFAQLLANYNATQYADRQYYQKVLDAVMTHRADALKEYIRKGAVTNFSGNLPMRLAIATGDMDIILALWQRPKEFDAALSMYRYAKSNATAMIQIIADIYQDFH